MASFLDNIGTLSATNPYVQQLPVEEMIQAERYMQQRHDEGVAKVQALVDEKANLPIQKQGVKDYLTQKLTSLRSQITSSINGSLDDARVQSQIGSMVGAIAQDPIIQRGVQSTLAIQNGMSQVKEEQKKGTANPYNIGLFQRKINQYMADPNLDTEFNGGYQPFFDYNKLWLENFSKVNPNISLSQTDFIETDSTGRKFINPAVLQELKTKGITADQIKSVSDLTFSDPRAQTQLNVEAEFKYGLEDPNSMITNLAQNYDSIAKSINDRIDQIKLHSNTNRGVSSKETSQLLDSLRAQGNQAYDNYQKIINQMATNPAEAKAKLYRDEVTSRYINAYSYQETSKEIKDNPIWKAQLQDMEYQLRLKDYNRKVEKDNRELAANTVNKDTSIPTIDTVAPISETEGQKGETTFRQTAQQDKDALGDARSRAISAIALASGIKPPIKRNANTGEWEFNLGSNGYKSAAEATAKMRDIWKSAYTSHYSATAAPIVEKAMAEIEPLERNVRNNEIVEERINKQKEQILNDLKASPAVKDILRSGRTYNINYGSGSIIGAIAGTNTQGSITLDNQDLLDAAILKEKGVNSKDLIATDARARLEAKLKVPGASIGNLLEGTGVFGRSFGEKYPELKLTLNTLGNALKTNPDFINSAQDITNLYKEVQMGNQPFDHTFDAATPEERRSLANNFSAAIGSALQLTNGKGDAGEFSKMINSKNENLIFGYRSQPDKGVTLFVRDRLTGDEAKFQLDAQSAQRIPIIKNDNEFRDRYGKALALTGYTTTDVAGHEQPSGETSDGGRSTAYTISTGNYTLKYQILGDGTGNQFFVNGWVFDKDGNKLLDSKPLTVPGVSTWMTPAQIVDYVDKHLHNDQIIKTIVDNN